MTASEVELEVWDTNQSDSPLVVILTDPHRLHELGKLLHSPRDGFRLV